MSMSTPNFQPGKTPKFSSISSGSTVEITDTLGGIDAFRGVVIEVKEEYGPTGIPALVLKVDGAADPVIITGSGRYRAQVLVDSKLLATDEPPEGVIYARKRPVVIEAFQFTGTVEQGIEIIKWAAGHALIRWEAAGVQPEALVVSTMEGEMRASIGDWVIKGVQNEFYPCNPQIFADTYELVGKPVE